MNVVPLVTPTEPAADDLPVGFDAFYLLYPKHCEKKDSRKVWDRLTADEQALALEAIVKWRKVWARQGVEEQYLCSPRRWLHGARWEDDLPTTVASAQQPISASHVPFEPAKPVLKGGYTPEVAALLRKLTGRA